MPPGVGGRPGSGDLLGCPGAARAGRAVNGGPRAGAAADRIPVLPRTFLPRARLWRCLDDAVRGALTTVTAPAGAGKTMGVAGWLRDRARGDEAGPPATWVDADGLTADRLTAALRTAAQGTDEAAPWPPPDDPGADPGAVGLVVVDDAERLDPSCVAVVDEMLDRAPQRMRLVLLSRWDVPVRRLLPMMLGVLTDVRGDVLRLDAEESAELVRRHAPDAPDAVVATIVEQAQGWCAVVVLAARAAGSGGAAASAPSAQGPLVSDLMAREVLASLTPRERHVVLSVCHGSGVTAEDACLAADDPGALDVLESMEQTGLLVQRDPAAVAEGVIRFRVHPVLRDVVRRRFVTGGVDVQRARATIARASDVEVARGRLARALELAAVAGPGRAGELVGTHGLVMVLRGEHAPVRAVVQQAGGALRQDPAAGLAVAVERWFADDAEGVGRWLEPVRDPAQTHLLTATERAVAGLLGAQLGLEPMEPAARAAADLVRTPTGPVRAGHRALLLALTGIAQTWLGDLGDAESSLSSAILAARSEGARPLEDVAVAGLALTEYLRGREPSAAELLGRAGGPAAGDLAADAPDPGAPTVAASQVPAVLLRTHAEPWAFTDAPPVEVTAPLPLGPVGAFCAWVVRARALALRGRAVEARIALDTPTGLPLPRHLEVVVEVERSLLAVANGDTDALGECAQALRRLEAPVDEALARGFLAACRGELGAAARFLEVAARAGRPQPDTATLALVARAQVMDALGAPEDATALLGSALRRAEPRADALAFAGWLGHATPVHLLLARSGASSGSAWVGRLLEGLTAVGPLSSRVSAVSPSVRESRTTTELAAAPLLTTRERDVLLMLARGATYEDIGRSLYVTTNTVKTHVTNVYRKLGARTRSEALAAARSLFLL